MTTTTQAAKPILVLGATGKTGRRVLARLTARGVLTRAGSRSAQPLLLARRARPWLSNFAVSCCAGG